MMRVREPSRLQISYLSLAKISVSPRNQRTRPRAWDTVHSSVALCRTSAVLSRSGLTIRTGSAAEGRRL